MDFIVVAGLSGCEYTAFAGMFHKRIIVFFSGKTELVDIYEISSIGKQKHTNICAFVRYVAFLINFGG
jgi:hypothetical protein